MLNIKFLILSVISVSAFPQNDVHHRAFSTAPSFGPLEEQKELFWIKNGQNYLKNRLDVITSKNMVENVAKNIVIFIGDGMSITTLMATRAYLGNENAYLSFEKFPFTGLSRTYALNNQVPDSACTASAIFTGIKSNSGTMGISGHVPRKSCTLVHEKEHQLKTIFKWAQEHGKSTGFVTNTRITHATPAATYAISSDRDFENDANTPPGCVDIASQLIYGDTGKGMKVQLGGGSSQFYPETDMIHGSKGLRKDNKTLVDEWIKLKNVNGTAKTVFNRNDLLKIDANNTDYLFGLFSSSHMSYYMEADHDKEPSLKDMTEKALEILSKNPQGYVLMVEGGLIDYAHHHNYAQMALNETQQFSLAIQHVKDVTDDQETLIVVTSDHSHTMTVSGYPERGNDILGIADTSDKDNLPFLTLSYANGDTGYTYHRYDNGRRKNPELMTKHDPRFPFPAMIPNAYETHGGEDVAVFASGPWSHLFVGNYEQSYIFHAMMYASCLGDEKYDKAPICSSSSNSIRSLSPLITVSMIIMTGLRQLLSII